MIHNEGKRHVITCNVNTAQNTVEAMQIGKYRTMVMHTTEEMFEADFTQNASVCSDTVMFIN